MVASGALAVVFLLALTLRVRSDDLLLEPGSPAPDFAATDLTTGTPVTLAAYRGKVILLNVWATWCHPCRLEMPSMERLHRRFAGTDFRIVAVSIDRTDEHPVRDFVHELGLTFDVLHDPAGDIQRTYQTAGVPESFVIDRRGMIVKKVIGAAAWDAPVTETLVRRLLDDE
jgi:peroxiredoxin